MSTLSDDLRTLSYEATLYFYPLVMMDVTRLQSINTPAGTKPGFGPPNEFHHLRAFPTADLRAVVRPNFDTLYSQAWLDLTAGPVILHAPDTDDNPGKRSTGTDAQDFVITGPGYTGDLPEGPPVIAAPTPYVWIIGRTQTNGPADYDAVRKVQNGYRLTPLGKPVEHVVDAGYDISTEPPKTVNSMSAVDFFSYAAKLLTTNPPHGSDFDQLARIANLGIAAGRAFDASGFSAEQRAEIDAGFAAAQHDMRAALPTLGTGANGWVTFTETMGVYGNYYFKRAVVALIGLGSNPAEDAVYPLLITDADGNPTTGDNDYVLHFDADGFQVANELDRFAVGDRDPLTYNADGSLDLYLQHTNPGPQRERNWLPGPLGPFGLTMRLYAPKREVLTGQWHPPPVHKA